MNTVPVAACHSTPDESLPDVLARTRARTRRWGLLLVLPFLLAALAKAASIPVPNGNFEGLTGTLPTSWSVVYGNGYEFSSTLRVHGGSRSLKIVDGSTGAAGAMLSAPIPVIEGRIYTAKVWANVDTETANGDVALYLDFWNAQDVKMATYSASISPALDTWTQIQVASQFAPHGAAYCTLMVYTNNAYTGQMFFDDATLDVNDIAFSATGGVAVDDPGMEGGTGSALPPAWTAYTANGFEAGSTALVYSGSRSVRITDTSASLSGGILSKKFSVAEGKNYVATVKCNVTSQTAGNFKVYVQYFDNGEDDYTPSEYLSAVIFNASTAGSWQTLTMNFTPPFLARYAAILLYSDNACVGTCYFDDVTVAAKSTGLSNGNFENVDLNNFPLSWSGYGTNASIVVSTNTTANRVYDISRSLKLVDSSGSLGGGAQSNQISGVTVGESYTATAQVYVESGAPSFYLQYFDASGAVLAGSPATTISTTGSWQLASVTGVAPPNTAYARVLCYSTQTNQGTAYYDKLTFSKDVVAVTNRKQLFIDDYIIKSLSGVTKTFNQGAKQGQIISGRAGTWEPNVWMYGSVVDDATAPAAERYKLYYVGSGKNCYMYSADALNWKEPGVTAGVPGLGLVSYNGSTDNNILGTFGAPSTGCVVLDPAEPNSAKRFKMLGSYYRPNSSNQVWWYRNYTSSDGKNFIGSTPTDTLNGWDVATAALDTANSKWVGAYKYYDSNIHRVQRMSQSTDHGNTWSVPIRAESLADGLDSVGYVVTDCYGMGWYVVDGVYIGIAWELYITDFTGGDAGPVGTQLVFSRDISEDWYRPTRTAPIPWGAAGSFDAGTIYTGNAVDVGNEIYWYYGASSQGHASGNLNIGLTKWRRDGFMSLNSGSTEGTILTKQLTYTGSALVLNLVSTGTGNYVKAELLDSAGNIISGYAAANSAVLNVDSVNQTVTWNGSSTLPAAGTVIQVKLYCKNAQVYSLKFQ